MNETLRPSGGAPWGCNVYCHGEKIGWRATRQQARQLIEKDQAEYGTDPHDYEILSVRI
jgi:hypothetical protein